MIKQLYNRMLFFILLIAFQSNGMNNNPTPVANNTFSQLIHQKYNTFKGYLRSAAQRVTEAEGRMGLRYKGALQLEDSPLADPIFIESLKEKKGYDELKKLESLYKLPKKQQELVNAQLKQNPQEAYKIFPIKDADTTVLWAKGNKLDRFINAERAKKLIEEEKLDSLVVPKKYVYQIKSGQWRVFADPIEQGKEKPLNLKEVQQLFQFMKKSNYWDFSPQNLVRTIDGKIAFIDTENVSFFNFFSDPLSKKRDWNQYGNTFRKAQIRLAENNMTDDARVWLNNEFKKIKTNTTSRDDAWKKPWDFASKKYDPSPVNIKRVQKFYEGVEYADWEKKKFYE